MKDKEQTQKKIIALLQENPIIQIACYKAGISRATFYRWQNEDPDFKKMCARSTTIGLALANDSIESVLLKKAREGEMKAVVYWLNNNHPKYKDGYQEYNNKKYDLLKSLEAKNNEADDNLEKTREGLKKLVDFMRQMGVDDQDKGSKEDDTQETTTEKK
jgi:hypothetical protein